MGKGTPMNTSFLVRQYLFRRIFNVCGDGSVCCLGR